MRRELLSFTIFCFALQSAAQEEYGNIWQFGYDVGLDFHACTPQVINGSNAGFEGCASVCDPNGQLLFYTNSELVWNSLNAPMPNGLLALSGGTLSQVLIVQAPLSDSLYYIITTTIQAQDPGKLSYHVVDISLNGGMGDVVSANNSLFALTSTEHVAATRHANGTDIWIVTHEYPANNFMAYLLTSSGINTTPVVSTVGPAFATCNSNMNARGEMKFSLDGSQLALAGNGEGTDDATNLLVLFDFDASTGVVSDPLELPYSRGDFGVSFSPDGKKLYAATWKAFNFTAVDSNLLCQFDLSSGDPLTIINSRQLIHSTSVSEPFGAVKMGPDGRIYVAGYGRTYLGVINEPDMAGLACDYVHNGLYLNGAMCAHGLNNYIEYLYCDGTPLASDELVECDGIVLFPNPAQGSISIRGQDMQRVSAIRLLDASGRTALTKPVTAGTVIDLSRLSSGGYVVVLLDVQGHTLLRRSLVLLP